MTARRNLVLQLDRSPDADRPVIVATGYSIRTLAFEKKSLSQIGPRVRFTRHATAVISIQRKGIEHTRPARRSACARRATKVESLAGVTCVRRSS
jgi:hypothetical protein